MILLNNDYIFLLKHLNIQRLFHSFFSFYWRNGFVYISTAA